MKIFFGILVFFLVFGWLVLLFSAIGLFYASSIVLSILVGLVISWRAYLSLRAKRSNPEIAAVAAFPRNDNNLSYLIIIISLFISLATCHFATPTVFGGRDQGSIATAAIELSQNHKLEIRNAVARDLFQKYGPGRALNFPGFDYTREGNLISRFPAGYTAYLASAYNLFGLKGIQYANFIPLFLFLIIFWLILKEIFDEKISFLGFLLAATFFPFLWFAKYALTETYMLFLVWTGIYFLLSLRAQRSNLVQSENTGSPRSLCSLAMTAGISLSFLALSALVRIEGIIFFLLAVSYVLFLEKKKPLALPKNFKKYLLISTLSLSAIYIYLNFPVLVDSLKNLARAFLGDPTKESRPSLELYPYLARIFLSYNVLPYLILGLAGIVWLAKNIRKNWTKPEFLPIFIAFPAFFYLLTPQITLDDPWLLRRFAFAVFPALIFYSIYVLYKFFCHKTFLYFTLVILIAANCVVSARFFTLSENKGLLAQIEKISQQFGAEDLILVDRLATGSGFSLASEPLRTLFDKQAVYFFNAQDLQYIDQSRYKDIYLIAKFDEKNPWHSDLIKNKVPQSLEIITNNFLEPSDQKFGLAVNVQAESFIGIWKIK